MSGSDSDREICFKSVKILKQDCLGVGCFGSVYKAQCDDLMCAAKIIHPTLVIMDPKLAAGVSPSKSHRLPFRRFEQECVFLSRIAHPHIVQYLGVHLDPASNLPVLLMELMDQSLTHFLEKSQTPLSFQTQVGICHDVALALSFLHSNHILHRDLSSNNVLMIRDVRAKITDFGMAIFQDKLLNRTGTTCPGTPVYMPPEAKTPKPILCDKTDCFSYGVLTIQILTKEFPEPEDRPYKKPLLASYEPEIELRQNHISLVPTDHPLRAMAIKCLKYKHENRPTSRELCSRIREVKSSLPPPPEQSRKAVKRSCPEPEIHQPVAKKDKCNDTETYSKPVMKKLFKQINELNQKDEGWDVITAADSTKVEDISEKTGIRWREKTQKAPQDMHRITNSVLKDGIMYFLHGPNRKTMYSFKVLHHLWTKHSDSPEERASLAVVNTRVVVVGGKNSNKLYSLVDEKWSQKLPSMYTKRYDAVTASSSSHLIVIGGFSKSNAYLKTVEILDIDTLEWSVVAHVPDPCVGLSSASICAQKIYIFSNLNSKVYMSKLDALVNSRGILSFAASFSTPSPVWIEAKNLPVSAAASVSIEDKLYAVGGKFQNGRPTTAMYRYNPQRDNWCIVSHINKARSQCFAAAVNKQMVVVGGVCESDNPTRTVETAMWKCV